MLAWKRSRGRQTQKKERAVYRENVKRILIGRIQLKWGKKAEKGRRPDQEIHRAPGTVPWREKAVCPFSDSSEQEGKEPKWP